MNYCSQCGKPVTRTIPEGDNRERHVCLHCEHIHYHNPKIIAGCIATLNDKVLLCRRAIEPRHGLWTLPAGFMENGETSLEGALRESLEEANARVKEPQLSCVFDIPHISQVYIFYRGELKDMDFAPGKESLEVELFREEEVHWNELAFPVIEKALDCHFNDRKAGSHKVHAGTIEIPWKWLRANPPR